MTAPDLVVVVPSRGRPEAARLLVQAFHATCMANTQLVFAVDDDDPDVKGYYGLAAHGGVYVLTQSATSMVAALNRGVGWALAEWKPFAVAFMGDDHRPRTIGWDEKYLAALRELGTGIVYGDDLLQGERLATQCAMTADIVRELGYMAPPVLTHLFVDNFWMSLGTQAGCLRYLPDVVVEHAHPLAKKAKWDDGYARVNDQSMYARDKVAVESYVVTGGLAAAVVKVRRVRESRAADELCALAQELGIDV